MFGIVLLTIGVMFGGDSLVFAGTNLKTRFSNMEFDPPAMMNKAEQTGDKLVFKTDPSIPGAGGTLTMLAGRASKGDLSSQLDAEWKNQTKGRKLLNVEPDQEGELTDGSRGLTRSAQTPAGGYFSISAYSAPNGVNFIVTDARDEMAAQMIGGGSFLFFMSLKLSPVGQSSSMARSDTAKGKQPLQEETPLEEMARLNREMMDKPMPEFAMPGLSEAPAAAGFPDVDPVSIPKLDKARIASIPSRVLSDQEVRKYVWDTAALVKAKLQPDTRALGDKIVQGINAKHLGNVAIENAGAGVYAMGNPDLALYLTGVAAQSDKADANTLSNYAALLTMEGAPQRAVVILQTLENKYPDNTTVLNNLAQAWFGLGDTAKAEKYLDHVLRLAPGHSQANATKAAIQESKGNKQAAIESMKKSMKNGYSEEKMAQLHRLGYDPAEKDIHWDEPFKEDSLKLHKVFPLIPPYYFKAKDALIAEAQWDAYHKAISSMKEEVEAQMPALEAANERAWQKFAADGMAGRKRASPLALKFTQKYMIRGKRYDDLMAQHDRWVRHEIEVDHKIDALRKKMDSKMKANPNASCGTREAIISEFMLQSNKMLADLQSEARIKDRIRWYNEWAQILRYYNDPSEVTYAFYLNDLKGRFLGYMSHLQHNNPTSGLCSGKEQGARKTGKLVYFEDIHCEKHYSFIVPMIGKIKANCHYMTTEFDVMGFVKGTSKDDLLTGEFVNGTLEFGVGESIGEGPVQVEVHGGGFIEVGKDGITDLGFTAGAEVKAGTDVFEEVDVNPLIERVATDLTGQEMPERNQTEITAGADVRIGLLSSNVTLSGTGIAEGLIQVN